MLNTKNTNVIKEGLSHQSPADASWPIPQPLPEKKAWQPPAYPVVALPKAIADYVSAVATFTQTPLAMAGTVALGLLATLLQGKCRLTVRDGWSEVLCLYVAPVAAPGERKDPVLNAMVDPVRALERTAQDAERAEVVANAEQRKLLRASIDELEKRIATAKQFAEGDKERLDELTYQLSEMDELHLPRVFADDVTSESLTRLLSEQKLGITICSSEGGIFGAFSGRYGKESNIDPLLKAHDGAAISVSRIGRDGESVASPRLSIILMLQPDVLRKVIENEQFTGRGLAQRFLLTDCSVYSLIGRRDPHPPTIPPHVKERYINAIKRAFDLPAGIEMHLSNEAFDAYCSYFDAVEKRLIGEWEGIREWGNKLPGTMLRIAALLHAAESDPTEPIPATVVQRAIQLAEFWGEHTLYLYGASSIALENKEVSDAERLLEALKGMGKAAVTQRELHARVRKDYPMVTDMDAGIMMLIASGYIRVETVKPSGASGGRPSTVIHINPAILDSTINTTKVDEQKHRQSLGNKLWRLLVG